MATSHGLFIPPVSDTSSFLKYLAVLVFEYNECVYCGTEKGSVEGVQTHMRDRGHCKVREGELEEFYDYDEEEEEKEDGREVREKKEEKQAATRISDTEIRLPSGAIINSRLSNSAHTRSRPRLAHSCTRNSVHSGKTNEQRAITDQDDANLSHRNAHDSRIAMRGEMGLTGLSNEQRRALMLTEKKMQSRQVGAEKRGKWKMVQAPVLTKYYKVTCFPQECRKEQKWDYEKLMNDRLRIRCIKLDEMKCIALLCIDN
jgi:pre-60S factor REI1